jgi:hypothetical protein
LALKPWAKTLRVTVQTTVGTSVSAPATFCPTAITTKTMLASLRTQRRATAQSLEQGIRSAFAQSSGAFEGVGFAQRQVAAARRNFDLLDSSYTLGVASILDLLDAQTQLLTAELAFVNASYGFLENLIAAERAISYYAFLEAPEEVAALVDELELELSLQP